MIQETKKKIEIIAFFVVLLLVLGFGLFKLVEEIAENVDLNREWCKSLNMTQFGALDQWRCIDDNAKIHKFSSKDAKKIMNNQRLL